MKNKIMIGILITLVILGGFVVIAKNAPQGSHSGYSEEKGSPKGSHSGHTTRKEPQEPEAISYWTCSMHPQVKQDKPGRCPICAMELIPVYKSDEGKITVDEHSREYLDIRSVPAEYRPLVKKVRLPGKVSHDYELYTLQQEYLSVLSGMNLIKDSFPKDVSERQKSLLNAVKIRLKLLGLSEDQIKELEDRKGPDESLIYPVRGKAWAQADVYEQDLSLVKQGQKVLVKVSGYEDEFIGRIHSIGDVLNPQTRSAKARVEIRDPGSHLKHEAFANLVLEVDMGERLSVPRTSVIDTGTRKVVYVDTGAGRYEMRQVDTGVEAEGFIEIKEGISEGEHTVANGNFLLDSQSTLTGGQSLLYSGSEKIQNQPKPQHQH